MDTVGSGTRSPHLIKSMNPQIFQAQTHLNLENSLSFAILYLDNCSVQVGTLQKLTHIISI